MVKAGFWRRIAAMLIDLALFITLYFAAVVAVTVIVYGKKGVRHLGDINPVLMSAVVGNLLWLAYFSLEWIAGTTPGKALLGMKVLQDDAAPAVRGELFLRFAMKHSARMFGLLDAILLTPMLKYWVATSGLSVFYHEPMNFKLARALGELCGLIVLAGFLLTLRADRRALYDRLTGTAVYRKLPSPGRGAFAMPEVPVAARAEAGQEGQ